MCLFPRFRMNEFDLAREDAQAIKQLDPKAAADVVPLLAKIRAKEAEAAQKEKRAFRGLFDRGSASTGSSAAATSRLISLETSQESEGSYMAAHKARQLRAAAASASPAGTPTKGARP